MKCLPFELRMYSMNSVQNFRILIRTSCILVLTYLLSACGEDQEPQAVTKGTTEEVASTPETEKPAPAIEKKAVTTAPPEPKPTPAPKSKARSSGFGPDILGIQLGMRPDEFVSNLNNYFKSRIIYKPFDALKDSKDATKGTQITSHNAHIPNEDEVIGVLYTLLPDNPHVMSIARYKTYPVGKEPSLQNVMKALTDKYGQPSMETTNPMDRGNRQTGTPRSWVWVLNKDKKNCAMWRGKPTFKGGVPAPRNNLIASGVSSTPMDTSGNNPDTCSDLLGITVGIFKGDIVGNISFRMIDTSEMATSPVKWAKYQEQLEQERITRLKAKANSNTPAL